jgi:integrase
MLIDDAIDRYIEYRVKTKPRSANDQRKTVRRLVSEFAGRELDTITRDELETWRDELDVCAASANKYMDRCRAFFEWARKAKHVPENPCRDIEPLDEGEPRRIMLDPQSFRWAIDAARHPRDRAAIALAVELMLRGVEIKRLRIKHVDLDARLITVRVAKGKNRFDEDAMAISEDLHAELSRWLGAYRQAVGILAPDYFLFPRLDSRIAGLESHYRLSPTSPIGHPWQVVKYALRDAGLPVAEGTGFHAVRRTAARLLFDHLCDTAPYDRALSHVSSLMHHTSRKTTETYLGITGDRVLRNKLIAQSGVTPLTVTIANPAGSVLALPVVDTSPSAVV